MLASRRQQMMPQAGLRKASWMSSRISQRMRSRRNLCSRAKLCSTTQRCTPSPEACPVLWLPKHDRISPTGRIEALTQPLTEVTMDTLLPEVRAAMTRDGAALVVVRGPVGGVVGYITASSWALVLG